MGKSKATKPTRSEGSYHGCRTDLVGLVGIVRDR